MDQESIFQSEQSSQLCLDQQFFTKLYTLQRKYQKMKHHTKSKSNQNKAVSIIQELVQLYTNCINYFEQIQQKISAYFQAKLKEINQYFRQIKSSEFSQTPEDKRFNNSMDLGTLSDIKSDFLIEQGVEFEQRRNEFNQNLMINIQYQDVKEHISETNKKMQKIKQKVQRSLKEQQNNLNQRIRKKRMFSRSFLSQSQLDIIHQTKEEKEQYFGIQNFIIPELNLSEDELRKSKYKQVKSQRNQRQI